MEIINHQTGIQALLFSTAAQITVTRAQALLSTSVILLSDESRHVFFNNP